jgi:ribonuclease D
VRNRRQLAAIRALWHARDDYAAQRDVAPGRVLPDAAIVDAARTDPKRAADLAALPVFRGPRQRRQVSRWYDALASARDLAESQLPPVTSGDGDGMPPASRWRDRDPAAAARLARCRLAVGELAEANTVLAQNLLASDVLRHLAWAPPNPADPAAVGSRLAELGARPWQVELTADRLADALSAPEPAPVDAD